MNKTKTLLIIGSVWPEPDSSAAGRRMMELIHLFKEDGWEITFASAAGYSSHAADLDELDIETIPVEMNSSSFDSFISDLKPDAVLFDRFMVEEQFGWRVAEQCPDALRILDTEDLHCLRRTRRKATEGSREWSPKDLLKSDVAKREIASILRCDCSLIISQFEMELLRKTFRVDDSLLHYLPFMLDPIGEEQNKGWPGFDDRAHFMTISNFRHPPNMDSVVCLSETVWPLVREKLPRAELHVYGAYPSAKAKALNQPRNGFYIRGRAENAVRVFKKARVCLAPLRFGAGLKGKLVEAMQNGTPSVTTGIGAEGIARPDEWPGAVAEDAEELAAAAIRLYSDQKVWEEAQQRGAAIISERFNGRKFGANFLERIHQLRDHLEEHRQKNFTGSMLMHHTAASTKYMSRWIEEKNAHPRRTDR